MSERRRRKQAHRTAKAAAAAPASFEAPSLWQGRVLWISAALVAVNLAIYASVRHHQFLNWDDPEYVSANPYIAGGLTWQGVSWALRTGHAANWHPLTWMSHMLDIQFFGLAAGPHLLMNVALHSANTVLLFLLLFQMTGALGRSAFVAGLFASHPAHVESVAWVAERKDVLSTLFWMLTIWAYLGYVRRPQPMRYVVVVGLFALGLMAKPMLVTLPFVLLLLDAWPLRRAPLDVGQYRAWRRLIIEKIPLAALAIASSVVTIVVQRQGGAVSALTALPLGTRAANAAVSYLLYAGEMVWPTRLAVAYPYVWPLPGWLIASAIFGLILMSVFAIRGARRHPYLPVGWLWYLGTLLPVIGLIQVGSQPMADRYTYVPLIGLFVIVAWGVPDSLSSWKPSRTLLPVAAGITIGVCALLAHRQVEYWTNDFTLWGRALAVTSNNARAHNNLGTALADKGRTAEATAQYKEALRINPSFGEANINLANGLAAEGKTDEAIALYRSALRSSPNSALGHNGLGSALDDQGRVDEAIAEYAEALRIDPTHAPAHNNMAAALLKKGRIEEATRELREAIRFDPRHADYYYNLGVALYQRGDPAEAAKAFEAALRIDPRHAGAQRGLNEVAAGRGRR